MSQYETIQLDTRDHIAVITLHRPEALNALNELLMREIVDAAAACDRDGSIGAIVIAGSSRAFAAGADIKEMAGLTYAQAQLNGVFAGWSDFTSVRTPTIAAVSGWALGGGCELAMMCDVIIAAESARFGLPEINLGVIPGLGGTQRLARAVGKAKAMDMLLTGRSIDADEAERAGLVSRVVPTDDLMNEALATAKIIASKSLPVVYAAKDAVNVAFESSLSAGLRFERQSFLGTFALVDQKEGMAAFLEKREPRFVNG